MLTGKRTKLQTGASISSDLMILMLILVLGFGPFLVVTLAHSVSGLKQPNAQGVVEAIGNEAGVVRRR